VKLLRFLNEPFPDSNALVDNIKGALMSGIIITIVLIAFKPLGIDRAPGGLFLTSLIYGGITFAVVLIYQLIVIYVLKIDREAQTWTLWKWLIHTILMILCIALVNIIYGYMQFDFDIHLRSVIIIIANTLLIGLVPVGITGSIAVLTNKTKFAAIADSLTLPLRKINSKNGEEQQSIEINAGNQSLNLMPGRILFAKSLQNYVQVYALDPVDSAENVEVTTLTVRKTLSSLETDLKGYGIERCHRSFLVNKKKIATIQGNAQGLKLSFEGTDQIVSVSRKYVDRFRQTVKR